MKNGDKPIRNPWVMLREEFDDWAILFNPDTGCGFGLTPTGVCLWKLLDGQHTPQALLGEILGMHADGLPETAGDDIAAFVDDLVSEGLAGYTADSGECENVGSFRVPGYGKTTAPVRSTYEPPKLVNLSSARTARGATCQYGSKGKGCVAGATDCCCSTGTSTGAGCSACTNGCSTSPGDCRNGTIAAAYCSTGTSGHGGP